MARNYNNSRKLNNSIPTLMNLQSRCAVRRSVLYLNRKSTKAKMSTEYAIQNDDNLPPANTKSAHYLTSLVSGRSLSPSLPDGRLKTCGIFPYCFVVEFSNFLHLLMSRIFNVFFTIRCLQTNTISAKQCASESLRWQLQLPSHFSFVSLFSVYAVQTERVANRLVIVPFLLLFRVDPLFLSKPHP